MKLWYFNVGVLGLGVGFLAFLAVMALRPGLVVEQIGYRGIGMQTVATESAVAKLAALNVAPEEVYELEPDDGTAPRAADVYENVQVLGHLSEDNFTRFMAQITEWVAPEAGCGYCHANADEGEFAGDDIYTKVVARRMIQMTQAINSQWGDHVGGAGVNCMTCHRGQNVPQYIWFEDTGIERTVSRQLGWRRGQNLISPAAAYSSMETDPFTPYIAGDKTDDTVKIRVQTQFPLPVGNTQTIQDAEGTYGLMLHMSSALGVNCTYCHNTAQFSSWERSPPQRTTAWYGIRMVRNLNAEYLEPLGPVYPEHRLGPDTGDAPKANCLTCHQGLNKPFGGADMVSAYPSLQAPGPQN